MIKLKKIYMNMQLLDTDDSLKVGDKNYVYLLIRFLGQILESTDTPEQMIDHLKHVS
jgi:hypothetical protein